MSRCLTWFPSGWFYQENPSYIRIREILQEMGILWKESAPEFMGVKGKKEKEGGENWLHKE